MIRFHFSTMLIALAAFILPALAQDSAPPADPATQKALDLEKQAGVVLYFAGSQQPQPDNAGTFYIAKPNPSPGATDPATGEIISVGNLKAMAMPELGDYLRGVQADKAIAVVNLNGTAQHWPEHVLMSATDKMTEDFRSAGFQRVVYVFDMGSKRKVYWDTDG